MYSKIRPLNLEDMMKAKNDEETPYVPMTSRVRDKPRFDTVKITIPMLTRRSFSYKHLTIGVTQVSKNIIKDKEESCGTSALPLLQKSPNLAYFTQLYIQRPKEILALSKLVKELPMQIDYLSKTLFLPRIKGYEGKKTLVLDLDETLTHSVKSPNQSHVRINITEDSVVNINIRPYAQDLLKVASQDFEIVIFTASQYKYANAILDHLDPMKKYIHYRLYRENCYEFNGHFIKDLRILGNRDMKDVVLVDNSLVSFALQVDNGIPISTWTMDLKDTQLRLLMEYLRLIKTARDVRQVNRNVFGLSKLVKESLSENLKLT
ncbi:hypothetical protein SteCoe_27283 [Stentor coeruleus]|uniref:FCP1 homology domain-containing protein n=1 Tax=Stentor coeruleus TaxID=5963 RepID=A0A1R2BAZ2_9CILI|nr:hypothetical protein SteCoe_27283 [Stentor coeruleus]